jgi:hypothetical protein
MKQYEYAIVGLDACTVENDLDKMGMDGWELIAVIPGEKWSKFDERRLVGLDNATAVFKREKE